MSPSVAAHAHSEPPAAKPVAGIAPGTRLGRSALLIHGLGYLFLAAAWVVALLLDETTEEAQPVQGVGGATALVFSVWSLVLSVKALVAAERPLLAIVNIAWVWVEVSVPCAASWWLLFSNYHPSSYAYEMILYLGLPVFVPLLIWGAVVYAPIAVWMVRRAERRALARGEAVWTRRRRWTAGLRYAGACLALLGLLVLPVALYVFSVRAAHESRTVAWQSVVREYTPDAIKHAVYRQHSNQAKRRFVQFGFLPDAVLLAEMYDSQSAWLGAMAWNQYTLRHPEDSVARACRVVAGEESANAYANQIFARNAGLDQIRAHLLRRDATFDEATDSVFVHYGYRQEMPVLLPILVQLLDVPDEELRCRAALHIVWLLPAQVQGANAVKRHKTTAWTPTEREDFERIRAAALEYLRQHPELNQQP